MASTATTNTMAPSIREDHDTALFVEDNKATAVTSKAEDLIEYTTTEVLRTMNETLEYCFSNDDYEGGENVAAEEKKDDDEDSSVLATPTKKTTARKNKKKRIVVASKKIVTEEGHETLWVEDDTPVKNKVASPWRKNKPRSIKVVANTKVVKQEEPQECNMAVARTPTTVGSIESPPVTPEKASTKAGSPKKQPVVVKSTTTQQKQKIKTKRMGWASAFMCFSKKNTDDETKLAIQPQVNVKSAVVDPDADFDDNSVVANSPMSESVKRKRYNVEFPSPPKPIAVKDDKDAKAITTALTVEDRTIQRLEETMANGGAIKVKTVENVKRFSTNLTPSKIISPNEAHNMTVLRDPEPELSDSDGSEVLEHEDPSFVVAPNNVPAELLMQTSWDSLIDQRMVDPKYAPNFQDGGMIARQGSQLFSSNGSFDDDEEEEKTEPPEENNGQNTNTADDDDTKEIATTEINTPEIVLMNHALPGTPDRTKNNKTESFATPPRDDEESKDVIVKVQSPARSEKKKSFIGRMRSKKS